MKNSDAKLQATPTFPYVYVLNPSPPVLFFHIALRENNDSFQHQHLSNMAFSMKFYTEKVGFGLNLGKVAHRL